MSVRVAVSDPLPMFRRGIKAVLDDMGFEVETPGDLLAWARSAGSSIVMLTIRAAADWDLLADLCQVGANVVVVAVLEECSVAGHVRALKMGATTAMFRAASRTEIRLVLQGAAKGNALLPSDVVRALANPDLEDSPSSPEPSSRERNWLRDLSRGDSVGQVAESSGYSERMMFRLLRDLYTKLGVTSRTAALILAKDRDWI